MKSKFAWIGLGAAVLIAIAVVILIVATVGKPVETTTGSNGTDSSSPTTTVERSLSGKTLEEDKNDVLAAAIALFESTGAPADQAQFTALMESVDAGTAVIPDEFTAKVRYVDSLGTDESIEDTLFQTIVTLAFLAKTSSSTDAVEALYDNATKAIVLDQEVGVAYVPTTLFVNSTSGVNGFSLEFVYLDGAWVLSPYMTLDELRLALVLQGAGTATTE